MTDQQIRSFRDLDAWQAAMDLAVTGYSLAKKLPREVRFDLGSQTRRAASSVPSNVAEGHAHRGTRTFRRHVRIALGSLAELDTQIELAVRLEFLAATAVAVANDQIKRVGQLLHGLERALERKLTKQRRAN
jgi:four helix bundle protein